MKLRSSTPSHDMAVEPKATQPPQPRSTTPLLDSAVELKPARPPPTNPYRTPTHSTSSPRGDTTSPNLLLITGVDDDDHCPTPPPAPDEGTARGSGGKILIFSNPPPLTILSVANCSSMFQYDILKVSLKKIDQNLPIECVKDGISPR